MVYGKPVKGLKRDLIEYLVLNLKGPKWHPCPKNENLWRFLIETFTKPNDIVLDPFMGSGTTGVVCKKANRSFIGFDINPEYCELANKRISNVPRRIDSFTHDSEEQEEEGVQLCLW